MKASTVGNTLVAAGAIVGVATVTAIATGFEIRLTAEMIQLLTYKALGAAALGLIIVGTWLGRVGKEKDDAGQTIDDDQSSVEPAKPALTEGAYSEMNVRQRDREHVERESPVNPHS